MAGDITSESMSSTGSAVDCWFRWPTYSTITPQQIEIIALLYTSKNFERDNAFPRHREDPITEFREHIDAIPPAATGLGKVTVVLAASQISTYVRRLTTKVFSTFLFGN